jgi:hypothetical protein
MRIWEASTSMCWGLRASSAAPSAALTPESRANVGGCSTTLPVSDRLAGSYLDAGFARPKNPDPHAVSLAVPDPEPFVRRYGAHDYRASAHLLTDVRSKRAPENPHASLIGAKLAHVGGSLGRHPGRLPGPGPGLERHAGLKSVRSRTSKRSASSARLTQALLNGCWAILPAWFAPQENGELLCLKRKP